MLARIREALADKVKKVRGPAAAGRTEASTDDATAPLTRERK
jgi:hypothetical protein